MKSASSLFDGNRLLIALLLLDCLGIFAIWGMELTSGAFREGLLSYQEGNIPLFHLIAECGMALVTLVGLYGWWRSRRWGRGITLLGLGMLTYAAINSLGWALHNDVTLAVPMIVTLILVLLAVPVLVHQQD